MIDKGVEITDAIAYGWDGGKARALAVLRPYVRHLDGCWADTWADPDHAPCNCGLRLAWRIRETAE